MRILIDPGTYNCLNLGDVAMLQVAVSRLGYLVPDATIQVFTDNPSALELHCPGVEAVRVEARQIWFGDGIIIGRGQRLIPRPVLRILRKGKAWLRERYPGLLNRLLGLTLDLRATRTLGLSEVLNLAGCLVVCGQGFLTDHVGEHAVLTLRLLATAQARRIPCFMLGQGIGPLTNKEILALAQKILPGVAVLTLREGASGVPLCCELGIPSENVMITGDEAIELAYRDHDAIRANRLGVNVRLSPSAGLTEDILPAIAESLAQFARSHHIEFVPLPIARDHGLRDVQAIRELLEIAGEHSDGGQDLRTPEAVIEAAGKCRVVLTGAYHAAVFALSQGIPAICIVKSNYFKVKMDGLAAQFGEGCVVVPLDEPHLTERLVDKLIWAWEAAPRLQESLRRAACLQILKSYEAYNRVGRVLRNTFPNTKIETLAPPAIPEGTVASQCTR